VALPAQPEAAHWLILRPDADAHTCSADPDADWGIGAVSRIGGTLTIGLFASLALVCTGGSYGLATDNSVPTQAEAHHEYQACLSSAGAIHDATRVAECKRLADQTESDRANCLDKLNLPKSYCDAAYPPRDPAATCALPDKVASVIDAELAHARFRCARELKGEEGKL
jgi:hypothetical protein